MVHGPKSAIAANKVSEFDLPLRFVITRWIWLARNSDRARLSGDN